MSHIIRLTVSNLLRISAATVTPDGEPLVIVAGKNQQGKSSLLQSIAIALSGKDLPAEPIKRGQASASVILETDDLIVTRTFSQTGGQKLEVRDKDGRKITSPQTKLDSLFSRTTFDPLSFANMEPAGQATTIRKIAGLDFTAELAQRAEIFAKRTEVGRDLKAASARRDGIHRDTSAPQAEISVASLAEQLERARETNRTNAERRQGIERGAEAVDRFAAAVASAEVAVEECERELKAARHRLEESRSELATARDKFLAEEKEVQALEDVETTALREQMQTAESTNEKVRANAQWRTEHEHVTRLQGQQATLTGQIEAIDKKIEVATGKAKFPIEGLAFNDAGVTFNGIAFEQASSAEKIRVSIAIACALNPNLRVMLIRDGSLLDEDSVALIAKYAAEQGAQVFMECVGDREDATVVIEDGAVASTPKADAKAAKAGAGDKGDLKLGA